MRHGKQTSAANVHRGSRGRREGSGVAAEEEQNSGGQESRARAVKSVSRSPVPRGGHVPVSRSPAEPRGPTSAACGGSRVAALPAQDKGLSKDLTRRKRRSHTGLEGEGAKAEAR